jgi:hypothetical protein
MNHRIVLFALFLLFHSSSTVYAHPIEPRLEINIDRIIPGGVVDVRGVGFDYEEVVTLALIGPQAELALGEVIADTEGVFLNSVSLPLDLTEGTYYFRGITTHHYTISPPLTVQGAPIPEGDNQESRDREDALLAPMPTFPPPVVTAPVPQVQVEAAPASSGNLILLALAALTVIGIAIGIGVNRKHTL